MHAFKLIPLTPFSYKEKGGKLPSLSKRGAGGEFL
jgi:hypothetical protein